MAGNNPTPERIRTFATLVRVHSQDLDTKKNLLKSKLKQLHEYWHDRRYNEFETEFEENMKNVDKYISNLNEQEKHLRRDADALERYLRGHR